MNRVSVHPPEVTARSAAFRWTVEPATPLYRTTGFTLRFPDGVDATRVPEHVWWVVALGCLHPHWPLLRPCRVELPVTLGTGEAETWLRLTDAAVATLESIRGTTDFERRVEIAERGPRVTAVPLADHGRSATAFSGGKDSLVQVGLLRELTAPPFLVTTTSPMPGMHDHETPRRRHVMREIATRGPLAHLEVGSDFRACWVNAFPRQQGYPVSVNELTDSLLYFGALLATATALGVTHLFLASETELQQNGEYAGRIVQHPHFMYSTVTQRTLQALLRPVGVRYGSLTSPLHSFQVQRLLWTRYRDLRDLQYSCWEVAPTEAMCSRCSQCLRLGLVVLALGDDPARMGLDLGRVLHAQRYWPPRRPRGSAGAVLPGVVVVRALDGEIHRSLRAIPPWQIVRALLKQDGASVAHPRVWRALLAYARLRARNVDGGPEPGFRAGFLPLVDPLLRERVATIFREHYRPEPDETYAALRERNDTLVRWITEPLGGEG